MSLAIVWEEDGIKRYASVAHNTELSVAEVAERVVPTGLPWAEMSLDEAERVCSEWMSSQFSDLRKTRRQEAYINEADPLFFKWQAGEATEAEWLAKRKEIRERYPDPTA